MLLKRMCFVLLGILSLWACKDKVVDPATDTATNSWILSNMKYWYYWNEQIPANPDLSLEPAAFFNSLLYKYNQVSNPNGDRFSWIQESADELQASLNGKNKSTGMDFKLIYYPSGSTNVVGIVLFVQPHSPAAKAGFKRGDVFTHINDQRMVSTNYNALLNAEGTLTFTLGQIDDTGVITEGTIKKQAAKIDIQEDPVFFDTLYQYGANKIGYIVYHQFVTGPDSISGSKAYDQKLEGIFGKLKAAQANALILDLRYNGGGYVSSATSLASLIGKVTTNDVFYYKEYNKTVTPTLEKQYGASFFYEKFQSKAQNVGSSLQHLIVLTSKNTASASELLINGLKPFMKVTLVGDLTYGKNVGSITITGKDKGIKWGMQPIVTKSFNGLKQSDYSVGFTPDEKVLEGSRLYAYGNPRDPLLNKALSLITGSPILRQSPTAARQIHYEEIGVSTSQKTGGNNMFFDR